MRDSIAAIEARHNGALTGPCGEREFREHAFDDIDTLLREIEVGDAELVSENDDLERQLKETTGNLEETRQELSDAKYDLKLARERLARIDDAEAAE